MEAIQKPQEQTHRAPARLVGVNSIIAKKFATYPLSPEWRDALGDISKPFRWLVYGRPKNGKTSFILQFCKEMSKHTKVYYNSMEEGISKTMQDAMIRLNMHEIRPGKFILADREHFTDMCQTIGRIKAQVVVLDSRDYARLTTEQYKKITSMYPQKSFVIICWEQSGKPLGKYAKDIEFMVDMVTHVSNFTATTNGRFGAQLKFKIWDQGAEKSNGTPTLFS